MTNFTVRCGAFLSLVTDDALASLQRINGLRGAAGPVTLEADGALLTAHEVEVLFREVGEENVHMPLAQRLDAAVAGFLAARTTSPVELKLSILNDTELFAETLVLLAGYPETRAVVQLADAEWKRRGDARFLAAAQAKGDASEAHRMEVGRLIRAMAPLRYGLAAAASGGAERYDVLDDKGVCLFTGTVPATWDWLRSTKRLP